MITSNRFVASVVLFIGVLFVLSVPGAAQGVSQGCLDASGNVKFPDSPLCKDLVKDQDPSDNSLYGPGGLVPRIAGLLSLVVGIATVIMIIVGGTRYVLSSGDAQNLEGAKNTIIFALIGLGVAIFAQLIVVFVVNRL